MLEAMLHYQTFAAERTRFQVPTYLSTYSFLSAPSCWGYIPECIMFKICMKDEDEEAEDTTTDTD